jgi:DNA-binding HxlR family transcriptional regulator
VRFLFSKGVIDTLLYIDKMGKAGYYELYKQNFVVSRQTFSNTLKILEEKGIISRKVIDGRPPRVEYNLTKKGKDVVEALKLLIKSLEL